MDLRFEGKRALVTGAGKGIGRGVVKGLVACGAHTIALSRTQADLDSLKLECPGIETVCVDLQDWDASRKAVEALGPIHLLVNNAGGGKIEPFMDVQKDSLNWTMNINVNAVVNVSQVVAKGMLERSQGGSIVNVSSNGSAVAFAKCASFCSAKAALDMLTKVMALELGPHQIRVNAVSPTATLTTPGKAEICQYMLPRIPQGKFAEVEDIVHPILYLLSDKADMINGSVLSVDGGYLAC